MDAVYFQNAHIVLHDDAAFRFESTPDGLFTVQLLDTDRSEVPPGVLCGHCRCNGFFGSENEIGLEALLLIAIL